MHKFRTHTIVITTLAILWLAIGAAEAVDQEQPDFLILYREGAFQLVSTTPGWSDPTLKLAGEIVYGTNDDYVALVYDDIVAPGMQNILSIIDKQSGQVWRTWSLDSSVVFRIGVYQGLVLGDDGTTLYFPAYERHDVVQGVERYRFFLGRVALSSGAVTLISLPPFFNAPQLTKMPGGVAILSTQMSTVDGRIAFFNETDNALHIIDLPPTLRKHFPHAGSPFDPGAHLVWVSEYGLVLAIDGEGIFKLLDPSMTFSGEEIHSTSDVMWQPQSTTHKERPILIYATACQDARHLCSLVVLDLFSKTILKREDIAFPTRDFVIHRESTVIDAINLDSCSLVRRRLDEHLFSVVHKLTCSKKMRLLRSH